MSKGNRNLATKHARYIADKRYGGQPRQTWSLDCTDGNFRPRGKSERTTAKRELREHANRVAELFAHF